MDINISPKTNESTTRFLSNSLLFCAGLLVVSWMLNQLEIFVLEKTVFTVIALACCIVLCIPKLMLIFRGRYEDWIKYAVILCAILAINIAYSVLTYHMIMMLAFPLIMSVMYFDPKVTLFTTVASVLTMSAAHIISCFISSIYVVSDAYKDPLKTLRDVLIYGLIPRLLTYLAFALICFMLVNISQKMLRRLNSQNEEIERSKKGLDKVIEVSRSLYGATNMVELASLIRYAVYSVTETLQGSISAPVTVVGFKDEDGIYHYLDNNLTMGICVADSGEIQTILPKSRFIYPITRQKVWDEIQVHENGIGMTFYENEELLFCISMEFPVDADDILLKNTLDILYNNIMTAVRQTKMNSDIFKAQESIILSFAEISESKSRQTGQHVKRVSEYVKIMAAYAGYDEKECEEIALAAMMHDIGKIMIPPEILEKPSRLTDDEFTVIKSHVTYGETLLKNSPGEVMTMARRIALQHHERWDGRGYLGYNGEEIDYISRYVAVADVFDALVSRRSYKDSWSPQDAYNEIIKQKGSQFAPHAVDIFVKSYDKILEVLARYPDQVSQSA